MTTQTTSPRFSLPVVPGIAVGWVLIGALVLVFPPEVEPEGMLISLVATTITILLVHFFAELFLGRHMLSPKDHAFRDVIKMELKSMFWMAIWVIPALIPAVLYSMEILNFTQTLEWTSHVIQILAFILGYLVGWVRARPWWMRVVIGFSFVLVISLALLIEALTHALVRALH